MIAFFLCFTANWLFVLFSMMKKCTVFSLSCICLDVVIGYLSATVERRNNMELQFKICLQVILWLCFERLLQGKLKLKIC